MPEDDSLAPSSCSDRSMAAMSSSLLDDESSAVAAAATTFFSGGGVAESTAAAGLPAFAGWGVEFFAAGAVMVAVLVGGGGVGRLTGIVASSITLNINGPIFNWSPLCSSISPLT